MLTDGPGIRVATSYPVPGGTATIHERAEIVSGRRGDVLVELHAVDARSDWHDFGLAHITDVHVARRIDTFRVTLGLRGVDHQLHEIRWV